MPRAIARPSWAIDIPKERHDLVIPIDFPYINHPIPPPPPANLPPDCLELCTCYGLEIVNKPRHDIYTAARVYAKRDTIRIWVLVAYTVTEWAGLERPDEEDKPAPFTIDPQSRQGEAQEHTITYAKWEPYNAFVSSTYRSFQDKFFRIMPNHVYARPHARHEFFEPCPQVNGHPHPFFWHKYGWRWFLMSWVPQETSIKRFCRTNKASKDCPDKLKWEDEFSHRTWTYMDDERQREGQQNPLTGGSVAAGAVLQLELSKRG